MILHYLEVWKLIGGDGSKVESLAIPRAEKDTIKEYDHHIIRLVTHHFLLITNSSLTVTHP